MRGKMENRKQVSSPGRDQSGDKLASTIPHSTVSHNSGEPGPRGEPAPCCGAQSRGSSNCRNGDQQGRDGRAATSPRGQDSSQDRQSGKALKGTASVMRGRPLLDGRPRVPGQRGLKSEHLPTVFFHCSSGSLLLTLENTTTSRANPELIPEELGDTDESLPPHRQQPVVPPKP